MFKARIKDCFTMPGKGLVVMLTEVEGAPVIGTLVDFLGGHRRVLDIGQPVEARDAETAQAVAPHGSVVLEWPPDTPAPLGIQGAWVQEVVLL